VRLANPSSRRGKRGGFRVVYYIRTKDIILMLSVYAKAKQADISPEKIRSIIQEYESTQKKIE
jgi:mRNA-degrading endonuclease RelE of RelBE toxin-antitoxin system